MNIDDTTMTPVTEPEAPEPATAEPDPAASTDEPAASGKSSALKQERTARKEAERQAREANDRLAKLERAELRREVAEEAGLTTAQARFIVGDTAEELQESAGALRAAFASPSPSSRLPKEKLRPGAVPNAEPDEGMGAVADRVLRY